MAIDTANKRNSAMLDPGQMPWPPDGAISVDDRLVMLEFYSGIAASPPLPTLAQHTINLIAVDRKTRNLTARA